MANLILVRPEEIRGTVLIRQGMSRFGPFGTAQWNGCIMSSWFGSKPLLPDYLKKQDLQYFPDAEVPDLPEDYLDSKGQTSKINVSCAVWGTEFQIKVWKLISEIPAGKTIRYGELAIKTGNPLSSRAVGTACGANWHAFLIPCHRVVYAGNQPVQYRWGPEIKRQMLHFERSLAHPENRLLWD